MSYYVCNTIDDFVKVYFIFFSRSEHSFLFRFGLKRARARGVF